MISAAKKELTTDEWMIETFLLNGEAAILGIYGAILVTSFLGGYLTMRKRCKRRR